MKITKYMKETLQDVTALLSTRKNRNNGIWLYGRAGSGKSTIGEYIAEVLNLPFKSISINASTDPIEFWGYKDVHGNFHEPPLIEIYRNGGVYLIDEIDNGNANTLAGMNRIISQTKLDLANGECIVKNDKFILIATANTTGDGGDSKYRGRCAIDKATIDRFIMQDVKYDDSLELELCNGIVEIMKFHKQIRKWIDKEELDYLVTPRTSEQLYTLLFYTKISLDNALKKTTFKGWEPNDIKCCLLEAKVIEERSKLESRLSSLSLENNNDSTQGLSDVMTNNQMLNNENSNTSLLNSNSSNSNNNSTQKSTSDTSNSSSLTDGESEESCDNDEADGPDEYGYKPIGRNISSNNNGSVNGVTNDVKCTKIKDRSINDMLKELKDLMNK